MPRNSIAWEEYNSHVDYWQLPPRLESLAACKRFLDAHNVHFTRGSSYNRLCYLIRRFHQGLITYDKCPTEELEGFYTARKIPLPSTSNLNKRAKQRLLAQTLETHEKTQPAKFNKFLDLPAEMRVIVYDMHLRSIHMLGIEGTIPSQPPITKVSKQVRQESLPIFYDACSFEVRVHQAGRSRELMHPVISDQAEELFGSGNVGTARARDRIHQMQVGGGVYDHRRFGLGTGSTEWLYTVKSSKSNGVKVLLECVTIRSSATERLKTIFQARASALEAVLRARDSRKVKWISGDDKLLKQLFGPIGG